MLFDVVTSLISSDLPRQYRDRHIDIHEFATDCAVDVIMPVSPFIEATRLIAEREFLDKPTLGQQVERSINRSVGNGRIFSTNTFEKLTGSQMLIRDLHLGKYC